MLRAIFVAVFVFDLGFWLGGRSDRLRGHTAGNFFALPWLVINLVGFTLLVTALLSTFLGGANLWRW
jgi:hypothetical protein